MSAKSDAKDALAKEVHLIDIITLGDVLMMLHFITQSWSSRCPYIILLQYHRAQKFCWIKFRSMLMVCIGTKLSPNLVSPTARVAHQEGGVELSNEHAMPKYLVPFLRACRRCS